MDNVSSIDFKFIESYMKDKFLRPFGRRLKYIYLGLDRCDDIFVLSDTEDTDFKYCDSMQTTGLIKIKNTDHLSKIIQWFDYCKIDRFSPCIFYFNRMISILNKMKWDDPDIKIIKDVDKNVIMSTSLYGDVVISSVITTHFTLTKLQSFVDKYTDAFFNNKDCYYDEPCGLEKTESVIIKQIAGQNLYDNKVLQFHSDDVKLVLLSGLDLLVFKSLVVPNKDRKFGIRLWADNKYGCVNYGSFFDDDDISVCTSRDNIFIFPIAKKEVIA